MKLIDLSLPITNNPSEPLSIKKTRISHRDGAKQVANRTGLSIDLFPNHEYLSLDTFELSTHTGTHIDSPFHYGTRLDNQPQKMINELPLEWFFSDGKIIDLSFIAKGDLIERETVKQAIISQQITINAMDIVLIYTGMSKCWGTEEYFSNSVGLSKEAIKFLLSYNIKVIGIDSYGFDRSILKMVDEYHKTNDIDVLWPSHFYGREKEYIQIERLCNLELLLNLKQKFKLSCFPVKLEDADASWIRAVAVVE